MNVGSSSEGACVGMSVGMSSLYYNIGSDRTRFSKEDDIGCEKDYQDNDFSKDD